MRRAGAANAGKADDELQIRKRRIFDKLQVVLVERNLPGRERNRM